MIKESSGLDDFSVQKDIVSICLVSVLPLPNACTLVSATLRECIYTCTCSSGDTACVLVHSESRLFLCWDLRVLYANPNRPTLLFRSTPNLAHETPCFAERKGYILEYVLKDFNWFSKFCGNCHVIAFLKNHSSCLHLYQFAKDSHKKLCSLIFE